MKKELGARRGQGIHLRGSSLEQKRVKGLECGAVKGRGQEGPRPSGPSLVSHPQQCWPRRLAGTGLGESATSVASLLDEGGLSLEQG